MKLGTTLLLVLAATVLMLSGVINPREAAASVDAVNQWPATPTIVSNAATGTVTGNYTAGMGNNRLMLVAVATRYSGAGAPTFNVTYGGVALTQIVNNTAQTNKIWLGYLKEASIGSGTKVLSVTNSVPLNLTNMYASVAVFNGVDQTNPIVASQSNATGATATIALTAFNVSGLAGNAGLVAYASNWFGQTSNVGTAGYDEIRDYAGSNINLASGYSVITASGTTAPTSTAAASAIGAFAAVSLLPATKVANILPGACGDCHGNLPQDGTARNLPPGQFPGSHEKHAGSANNQYKYACTYCHYNNTTNNHANGFKNITGSSLPGASYNAAGGKKVPVSNVSTLSTCSNVTCHSTGRAARQYTTTPAWGGATTCLSCHGGRSATNPYPPARSTNNFSLSTTHSQHLKYLSTEMNCQTCHGKTAANHTALKDYTGAIYHGNGAKTVIFTDIAYGSYTSYKTGTKMCANTACHGGSTRNAWTESSALNSNNTCVHCHGVGNTSAALPNTAANRRFFAPGYKVTGTTGTSTDQIVNSNNIRVGSHFKHLSSAYMKNIKCNECHQVPATPFSGTHMTGTRFNSQTLTFAQASTANITIGVAAPGMPSRLAAFSGYTNGTAVKAATCSSTYCHGSRLKTGDTSGSYTKPYWNYSAMINYTSPNNSCGRCHGNPPTSGTSQTTHASYVSLPTTSCSGCHSMVVNSGGQIINKALHINGQVNATGGHEWSFGGLRHKNGGTGSIQANPNTYSNCTGCHSLTGGGSYPVTRGVAANINCEICHTNQANFTTTPGCGDCHGTNANGGQPTGLANAFPNWSGSHQAHIARTYVCTDCHLGGGAGAAIHGNYSGKTAKTRVLVNVAFNTGKSGTAATWASGALTCGTSICHGQKSPVWGTRPSTTQCTKCHGQANYAYLTNFSSAQIAPGGTGIDTGGNKLNTSPRVGVHQEHLLGSSNISYPMRCNECHTVESTATLAAHLQYTTARPVFGKLAKTGSHTPTVSRVSGVFNCANTYCHSGGFRSDGTLSGQSGFVSRTPVTWNTPTFIGGTSVTDSCINKCHALPPGGGIAGDSHSALLSAGSYTTFASLAACSSNAPATGCHPDIQGTAASITSVATIFVSKSLHVNGIVEGGTCVGCHSAVTGNRVAVASQMTGVGNSHHYQGAAAIDGKACYACHWEANSDGSINATYHKATANVELVVWNATTRPAAYTANVTAVQYLSGGSTATSRAQFANINTHCLGCHGVANKATQSFTLAGDISTPAKYAWDGLSVGERYSQPGTTTWGKVTGNSTVSKVQTKAFSAHGNATANQRGWSTVANTYTAGANATSNVMCFDCHNSHGSTASAGAAITTSYSSATGRRKGGILKDTVAGKGGYTMAFKPVAAGSAATKNAYSAGADLCFECHKNATATTTPWGYNATFGVGMPAGQSNAGILGYHDTPEFAINATNASTGFPAALTYTYKAGKTSSAAGGHFGVSSALVSAITKRAMDAGNTPATDTNAIKGLCTPCHDPHGVTPSLTAIPAGQAYGVPLLKGSWVTSPYKQDVAPTAINETRGGGSGPGAINVGSTPLYFIDQNSMQVTYTGKPAAAVRWAFATSASTLQTTSDTQFAGLCTGCHAKAALAQAGAATSTNWKQMTRIHNSVKGWAGTSGGNLNNSKHAYTCSKCHTAHNSRLPKLLVTNCLDVKHRGRVTTGGNMAAQYAQTGGSGAGVGRFPGGGGGTNSRGTATNPGPWFFGTAGQPGTTPACHASGTAGGTTYSTGGQLWNTKSTW